MSGGTGTTGTDVGGALHPWHEEMQHQDEWPFYVVRDELERWPNEHYCAPHLIGETEYLAKHSLDSSEDIWVDPICCEEEGDYGLCDECPAAPSTSTEAVS